MTLTDLARQLRPLIERAAASLDDADALQGVQLFPRWRAGISVEVGQRYQHGGILYKGLQAHTTQEGWEPDKTPALWAAVAADPQQGTLDNPIPAVRGMEYTYGLYYSDGGTVYLCKRTGEEDGGTVILQYLPHELVGQYFEEVTENE